MTFSDYQLKVFDWIEHGSGHAIVNAEAGSGKTFTLVEIAKRLPKEKLSVALAFGTDIAAELQRKMPFWVQASTSHVYGKRLLERHFNKFKYPVDADKCRKIAKRIEPDIWKYWSLTGKLVSHMKNFGYGLVSDAPSMQQLVKLFELNCEGDETRAIELAGEVFEASLTELKSIDFDDMLYLPLKLNVVFDKCDFVLLDEAQDINVIQRVFARRMLAPTGRLIAVGDPNQAIFGFRGADYDSIEKIQTEFNAKVLELSISYRCAVAIVEEARRELKWTLKV